MRRIVVLVVALSAAGMALAANVQVKIPKEDWAISFDSPPLSKKQDSKKPGEYSFSANSGRFNISLFVEKPRDAGTSNQDVYHYYWPRASQNPMIAKETVTNSETDRYVRVQYDIVTSVGGKSFRQRNVNYYFAFQGKWVDVHISVGEPTTSDDQVFSSFDTSLRYGK